VSREEVTATFLCFCVAVIHKQMQQFATCQVLCKHTDNKAEEINKRQIAILWQFPSNPHDCGTFCTSMQICCLVNPLAKDSGVGNLRPIVVMIQELRTEFPSRFGDIRFIENDFRLFTG